ncbi:hypothetical protein [Ideonella sp. YS5]|uniref:hypothetical protein n=1 Tax=Ideonella sp. YS5 TaxID=3453714 RepID=UPI003EEB4174
MDILRQYAERPTDTHTDFDEVAREVPRDVLSDGMAQAMRSDQTPAFADLTSRLFGQSDPNQRAGLLGQLIRSLGPGLLSSIAGGALARLGQGAGAQPQVSAADAAGVSSEQVREIADEAARKDPSLPDRVGELYAQHPEVFKILGGSVLAIALGQMAKRMK